jgi:cell division protein FtsL
MATAYRWSGEIPQGQKAGSYEPRLSRLEARHGMQVLRRPLGPGEIGQRLKAHPPGAGVRTDGASSLTTRSLRRELMGGNCKKPAMVEFYTVKRIDNSRLVRHVEPAKMRKLYRTAVLGGIIAVFFMMYTYQHFRCIDLSFQLEDLKGKQAQAAELNGKLKLEIATLRDPHRIDVIAQHELGFKRPEANQVREYMSLDGSEVAALQYTRLNRRP